MSGWKSFDILELIKGIILFKSSLYQLFIKISKEIFEASWWVTVIALIVMAIYSHGTYTINKKVEIYADRLVLAEDEIKRVEEEIKELSAELEYTEDPRWIELTLLSDLNLSYRGWYKVFLPEMPKD